MKTKLERPECPACGDWTCQEPGCEGVRRRANRYSREPQTCPSCHSTNGVMKPVRHIHAAMIEDHNEFGTHAVSTGHTLRYPLTPNTGA